jgi:hypothetical protein
MWRGSLILLVVAVACAAGCDDSPPASVQSFCGGICAGATRCDARISQRVCQAECVGDPRNEIFDDIRPEAAAIYGACLAKEDCTTIFDGPFDDCWARAQAETATSPHLRAFCPDYSAAAFECGYWYSVESCQESLTLWSDGFLDRLMSCTQQAACEAQDACIETTFGGG